MNHYKKLFFFLTLVIFFLPQAKGQDTISLCTCSGMNHRAPIGVMIDHAHFKGEWMVSYRYMQMFMQGNLMGTDKVSDEMVYQSYLMAPDKMRMQMHMGMVMYGLSDKFTLMGMITYVSSSMGMSMRMSGHNHMGNMSMTDSKVHENTRTSGFGDIKLYGLYNLLNIGDHQISLNAGISIPTGSISHRGNSTMVENRRYSYSLQTGTGSFSVLPGITYIGSKGDLSWGTQLTSDIKTGKNAAGYKWGDELAFTGWLGRNWNEWISNSLRIAGRTSGRIQGFDNEIARYRTIDPDSDINNSGGQKISLYAGVNFVVPRGILNGNSIGIEYGFPIYQNINGLQMKTKALINAGWQYAF